jgi:hypothetical protein
MEPVLNEQSRRRWAATEAKALGRGGVSCVVRVTGLARRTVCRGLDDIPTRGDPMKFLLWTSRSLRKLSKELANKGHEVSHTVVGELLQQAGYSLQANRKTREGTQHMDRDAQF